MLPVHSRRGNVDNSPSATHSLKLVPKLHTRIFEIFTGLLCRLENQEKIPPIRPPEVSPPSLHLYLHGKIAEAVSIVTVTASTMVFFYAKSPDF